MKSKIPETKVAQKDDNLFRRKLNPGDVVYLVRAEHHKMVDSKFMPLESSLRIPLRLIDSKVSELNDLEKLFLNLIVATHLQLEDDTDFSDTTKHDLANICQYYAQNKVSIWNVLMENIYYQFSPKLGNSIVVNFNKMSCNLPGHPPKMFRTHKSHMFPEAISRMKILRDEVEAFKSKTSSVINDLLDVIYYDEDSSTAPAIFTFGAVELNGVRLDGTELENKSWNFFDWKYSGIKYIVKYDKGNEIPVETLKLKSGTINRNNKRYKLDVRTDQHVPAMGINVQITDEGFSRLRHYSKGRTIIVGKKETALIKPDMLRKGSLKKYFILK